MTETNVVQAFLQARASVVVEVVFEAPAPCVTEIQKQAAVADSPLVADTPMYSFLVAKGDENVGSAASTQPKQDDASRVWRELICEYFANIF